MTYHELDLKSNSLARGLQETGVKKGDRVAVSLGNNVEYSIVCLADTSPGNQGAERSQATYALFKLGAVLVSQ